MNLEPITILGLFAAFCTTSAFIPQVIKTTKTKNTKDISLHMYVVFLIGVIAWLSYGIILKDIPIITANAVTVILASWILVLKIKHG